MSGAGQNDGGVLVDGDLHQGLEVAQLQRERVGRHQVGVMGQLAGGECLTCLTGLGESKAARWGSNSGASHR
jgi:hypothetical protein